jgi:hypothetical protein
VKRTGKDLTPNNHMPPRNPDIWLCILLISRHFGNISKNHIQLIYKDIFIFLVRLISSGVSAITFISYSIYEALSGEPINTVIILLIGVLFVWAILLGPLSLIADKEISGFIASLVTILSIVNVLNTGDVTDSDKTNQNIDLFQQALQVKYCPTTIQPDESKRAKFQALKDILVKQCGFQNHQNIYRLAIDAAKARYLDPVSGLADNIHSEFIKDEPVTCLSIAKRMNEICPGKLQL